MEENKYLELLQKHWSKLVLAILLLACVSVWTQRLISSKTGQRTQDYFKIRQSLEKFSQGEMLSSEAIIAAENILLKRPDLHPQCNAMLAYSFFAMEKPEKASPYVRLLLDRAEKENLPEYFLSFGSTSLLIGEKKFEQALFEARQLHYRIKEEKHVQTLCAMNLLRIVYLTHKTYQEELKQSSLEELQRHPQYSKIASLFQEGEVQLENYFAA